MSEELLKHMAQAVIDGDDEAAADLARQALERGIDPLQAINDGFTPGMDVVGELYSSGEYFLPDLILGGEAMKAALAVLEPVLQAAGQERKVLGAVVLGFRPGSQKRSRALFGSAALVLLVIALVAGCTGSPLSSSPTGVDQSLQPIPDDPSPTAIPYQPASAFSTPEKQPLLTLPDYPIPTPVLSATPAQGEPEIDTSPVVRIVIPGLLLDTEVKYVPYDGFTWLIDGLRGEVAWLGNTSWPGLGSNTVLAGHVTVSGLGNGPFRYLENLKEGDQVKVYTEENEYVYTMREQVTVNETDLGVLLPTTQSQLTLITCTGWDEELEIYRFRRVVFADLLRTDPIIRQGSH